MDSVKQRIVLKFLSFKSLGYKAAHRKLSPLLGEGTYSLSQTKRWTVGSRKVVFDVKAKGAQLDPVGPYESNYFSPRTEIQSRPLPAYDYAITIQGIYEP
jgi:hypothetical protein